MIYLIPDHYSHSVFDIDKMFDSPKVDLDIEELRSSDGLISDLDLLLIAENLDAPEDRHRIIIITAKEQELPNGAKELPTAIDIVKDLDVVEMNWGAEY